MEEKIEAAVSKLSKAVIDDLGDEELRDPGKEAAPRAGSTPGLPGDTCFVHGVLARDYLAHTYDICSNLAPQPQQRCHRCCVWISLFQVCTVHASSVCMTFILFFGVLVGLLVL